MKDFKDWQEQLAQSLEDGTVSETVQFLLEEGHRLSEVIDKKTGDTFLHWLCANAPLDVLHRTLKEFETPKNIKNRHGETPLIQAAQMGKHATTSLLVHFGGNKNVRDKLGGSALSYARSYKGLNLTPINYDYVISWKDRFINAAGFEEKSLLIDEMYNAIIGDVDHVSWYLPVDEFDNSLFAFVIDNSDLQLINTLWDKIIPEVINHPNQLGQTPLHTACLANDRIKIAVLLENGADASILDWEKSTAQAVIDSNESLKDFLSKYTSSEYDKVLSWVEKFTCAVEFEEKKALIDELEAQDISWLAPIDDGFDNSIFAFVVENSDLKLLQDVLQKVPLEVMNYPNQLGQGQTPLHNSCLGNNRIKMAALLEKGANPSLQDAQGFSALGAIQDNEILSAFLNKKPKSLSQYIEANEKLEKAITGDAIFRTIKELLDNEFDLQEPINEWGGSILHWLVERAPIHVMKEILDQYPIDNIDPSDDAGETPLMRAAGIGRQLAVNLLIAKGADTAIVDNLGLTALDHALNANSPIEFNAKAVSEDKTVYEYLLEYPLKSKIKTLEGAEKIQYCFKQFNKIIRDLNWQYDGTAMDYEQQFLLDCSIKKEYVVNCVDLSNALVCFLKAQGIHDVSTVFYENIKSIPFALKGDKIKGEFICFDKEVQEKSYKNGHFDFARHCVVKCEDRFYDPTFCCHYDNWEDILNTDMEIELDKTQNYINISASIEDQQVTKDTLLNLKFLASIHSIFPKEDWEYLQRGNKLMLAHRHQDAQIDIALEKDNSLQIFSEKLAPEILTRVINAWQKSWPEPLEVNYGIASNLESLAQELRNNLTEYGIESNIDYVEEQDMSMDLSTQSPPLIESDHKNKPGPRK